MYRNHNKIAQYKPLSAIQMLPLEWELRFFTEVTRQVDGSSMGLPPQAVDMEMPPRHQGNEISRTETDRNCRWLCVSAKITVSGDGSKWWIGKSTLPGRIATTQDLKVVTRLVSATAFSFWWEVIVVGEHPRSLTSRTNGAPEEKEEEESEFTRHDLRHVVLSKLDLIHVRVVRVARVNCLDVVWTD